MPSYELIKHISPQIWHFKGIFPSRKRIYSMCPFRNPYSYKLYKLIWLWIGFNDIFLSSEFSWTLSLDSDMLVQKVPYIFSCMTLIERNTTYNITLRELHFILLLKLVVSHKIKKNGLTWNYIRIQGWLDCWISLDKHLGQGS